MQIGTFILIILAGYLLGSLNVSILLSRHMSGGDVREKGSGNAGATNMARVYGWRAGALTLAGDILKSTTAMLIGYLLLGDQGLCAAGVACLVGHCFPVFHEFRGGKGVSVGAAVAMAVDWRVFLVTIAVFLLVAFLTKKVSLGSVSGSLAVAVTAFLFAVSLPRLILALFGTVIVIFQHRQNLRRVFAGTEPDFAFGKEKQKKK